LTFSHRTELSLRFSCHKIFQANAQIPAAPTNGTTIPYRTPSTCEICPTAQGNDIPPISAIANSNPNTVPAIFRYASPAIASAVEEQGSATQEIARNVQQAAQGTGEISANVVGVQQAAGDTGAAAHQVLQASSELSKQSETMRGEVEAFLSNIKAA